MAQVASDMSRAKNLTPARKVKPSLPMHNTKSLSHKDVKSDVKRTVGQRFIDARNINGWSQSEAAQKLGYQNSAQLSQWEQSKRTPPLHMVAHASTVYTVSTDFLLGIADDPDRDPRADFRRSLLRSAEEMLSGMSSKLCDALLQHTMAGGPANESALMLLDKAAGAARAVRRYFELNKEQFEESKGSSSLLAALDTLDKCVADSRAMVARHVRVSEIATKRALAGQAELPLFEAMRLAAQQPTT